MIVKKTIDIERLAEIFYENGFKQSSEEVVNSFVGGFENHVVELIKELCNNLLISELQQNMDLFVDSINDNYEVNWQEVYEKFFENHQQEIEDKIKGDFSEIYSKLGEFIQELSAKAIGQLASE